MQNDLLKVSSSSMKEQWTWIEIGGRVREKKRDWEKRRRYQNQLYLK